MNTIIEQPECPICFECIGEKNNITTDCGHKFHANCLMTNVSLNGFGCPCCRTAMVEVPENDQDTEYTDIDDASEYTDDDDDTATLLDDHVEETYSDDALRGLRLLTNLLEGNEHEQADVVAENYYAGEEEYVPGPAPPREFIANTLREQGITYEQLAAWILIDHDEFDNQIEDLERFSNNLWERIRTIINNYRPDAVEEVILVPQVEEAVPALEEAVPEAISPIILEEEFHLEIDDEYMVEDRRREDRRSSLAVFELMTAQEKSPFQLKHRSLSVK